jgi:hypothetical protein
MRHCRILACAALCAAAALLPAERLHAESAPAVSFDVLLGFNGTAREGRFAPVLVGLQNPGPARRVEVRLTITWGSSISGTQGARTFSRSADLGPGASRRLAFVVPVSRGAKSLSVSVRSAGAEVTRQEVALRPLVSSSRFIAVVSADLSLDSLSGLSDSSGSVRVVHPRLDDLPSSWPGWDGVDVVVVHDTYFQQVSPDQAAALERWVATGGTLVFTGGPAGLQHAAAGLGRLLPVEVTGLTERTGLSSLAGPAGVAHGPSGRFTLAASRVLRGTARAEDAGVPLLVESRLGKGTVWFAAFDPGAASFTAWDGALPLWRMMDGRDRQTALGIISERPLEDPWITALLTDAPLSFPPLLAVAAGALVYLALLVPIALGRKKTRPGLRLLLLLGAATACSAGSWYAFNTGASSPAPRTLDAAVVEMRAGDGLAVVTEKVAVVSSRPASVSMSLASREPALDEPPLPRVASSASAVPGFEVALGARPEVRDLLLGRWDSRLLVFTDVVPLPVEALVSRENGAIHVSITNGSARILHTCFFWSAGRGYPIGDVGPGQTVRRTLHSTDGVEPETGLRLIVPDPRRAELWSRAGAEHIARGSAVVAGWMAGPVLVKDFIGASAPAGRNAISLLLVEVQ